MACGAYRQVRGAMDASGIFVCVLRDVDGVAVGFQVHLFA